MGASKDPLLRYNADFVRKCAVDGIRFDGRSASALRELQLQLIRGPDVAVAEVSVGDTKAVCRVGLSLVAPDAGRPAEGKINVTVDVSATVEVEHRGVSLELARICERTVRDISAVDKEALCVVAGAWVWAVTCNVHVLAHDGNLDDACVLAALAALQHVRRPHVDVVQETDAAAQGDDGSRKLATHDGRVLIVRSPDAVEAYPLPMLRVPLCVTYALLAVDAPTDASVKKAPKTKFDDEDEVETESVAVLDPSLAEEAAAASTVSFAFDAHSELCAVHKMGGEAVSPDALLRCAKSAAVQAKKLHARLKAELAGADAAAKQARLETRRALKPAEPVVG